MLQGIQSFLFGKFLSKILIESLRTTPVSIFPYSYSYNELFYRVIIVNSNSQWWKKDLKVGYAERKQLMEVAHM